MDDLAQDGVWYWIRNGDIVSDVGMGYAQAAYVDVGSETTTAQATEPKTTDSQIQYDDSHSFVSWTSTGSSLITKHSGEPLNSINSCSPAYQTVKVGTGTITC